MTDLFIVAPPTHLGDPDHFDSWSHHVGGQILSVTAWWPGAVSYSSLLTREPLFDWSLVLDEIEHLAAAADDSFDGPHFDVQAELSELSVPSINTKWYPRFDVTVMHVALHEQRARVLIRGRHHKSARLRLIALGDLLDREDHLSQS